MFNSNQTVMELRLTGDPERSDRADVVKCLSCMFQGKKDDDTKPIWINLQAWKYQARVLEGLSKGRQLVVGGNIKQDTWTGNDGVEKTSLVLTADWIAEKLWADSGQQSGGGQPIGGQGGYNPNNQQGKQQGQGGGYQGGAQGGYQQQPGGQGGNQGGYQQSGGYDNHNGNNGGGQGGNYPQPPDDSIPF